MAERWLDRNTLRPVYCVDDNKYKGLGTEAGSSPKNVLTSTIGDELKVYSQGKAIVYSIAPTRDAAVLSAGHAADAAIWIDDESGEWCSSTYYDKELPKWASEYNRLYPALKEIAGKEWTPDNYYTGNFTYFMVKNTQTTFSDRITAAYNERTTFDSDTAAKIGKDKISVAEGSQTDFKKN